MKIVVAASVLQGREAFSTLGRVTVLPDREIRREDLHDADALIVRSQTRVTAELLAGTPVSFVATATAGADHFDTEWLTDNGIAWTRLARLQRQRRRRIHHHRAGPARPPTLNGIARQNNRHRWRRSNRLTRRPKGHGPRPARTPQRSPSPCKLNPRNTSPSKPSCPKPTS